MDGVDAALVSFEDEDRPFRIVHSITEKYPTELRANLARAIGPETRLSLHEFAGLNISVGRWFAHAANRVLEESEFSSADVIAIGSHGQTLRHSPDTDPPYSIQIGDPATIATRCSITTVGDFRALDIAAGGQGAPLVPAFHEACFRDENIGTVVVNIGGIANITVLPPKNCGEIMGFDTGPGNCLLDEWIWREQKKTYDESGQWAASGQISKDLLNVLMADEYIRRVPPKSTGREYFNLAYLLCLITKLGLNKLAPEDIQATLTDFTAASIRHAIEQACRTRPHRVFVCGGGAMNMTLLQRLRDALPNSNVQSTQSNQIDPEMIEAAAFAWLAMQRLALKPVRLTTGSSTRTRLLGAVYIPSG